MLFQVRMLSPPISPDQEDTSTPASSIEDRIKKVEEEVEVAVREVIEDAADEGNLDELGVDSTSLVVTNGRIPCNHNLIDLSPLQPRSLKSWFDLKSRDYALYHDIMENPINDNNS